MDHQPEPEPSDPTLRLTHDVYYVLVHTLRGTLLAPVNDTPEERARRDHAAIAQVAAMLPGNADEAFLAAQCAGAPVHRDGSYVGAQVRGRRALRATRW